MSNKAHWIIRIGGWFSFVCTMFLAVIVYITLVREVPIEATDSVTTITKQNGVNVLTESRGFVGSDNIELTIYRTLYRQGNQEHAVAIEGGVVINQTEDYVVLRSIILPPHISGQWCSKAVVFWRPMFSLRQHSTVLTDLCFEVPHD
jgi:hypothetical protein